MRSLLWHFYQLYLALTSLQQCVCVCVCVGEICFVVDLLRQVINAFDNVFKEVARIADGMPSGGSGNRDLTHWALFKLYVYELYRIPIERGEIY